MKDNIIKAKTIEEAMKKMKFGCINIVVIEDN